MDPTIADWSPAELRRFIVNQILSEPGAVPSSAKQSLPAATDGGVPVWDAAQNRWGSSGTRPIEGRQVAWHVGATSPVGAQANDIWIWSSGGTRFWMFVYDPNEVTYKWKFVGGTELAAQDSAAYAEGGGYTFNGGGTGPQLTVPLTGDYHVRWQAAVSGTPNAAFIWKLQLGVASGGFGAPAWECNTGSSSTGGASFAQQFYASADGNFTAGVVLGLWTQIINVAATYQNRRITVIPYRVA